MSCAPLLFLLWAKNILRPEPAEKKRYALNPFFSFILLAKKRPTKVAGRFT
jgi:hypothetical protein